MGIDKRLEQIYEETHRQCHKDGCQSIKNICITAMKATLEEFCGNSMTSEEAKELYFSYSEPTSQLDYLLNVFDKGINHYTTKEPTHNDTVRGLNELGFSTSVDYIPIEGEVTVISRR